MSLFSVACSSKSARTVLSPLLKKFLKRRSVYKVLWSDDHNAVAPDSDIDEML